STAWTADGGVPAARRRRTLDVVTRSTARPAPAQRHLVVARRGGQASGRRRNGWLRCRTHLVGVPTGAATVHRADHVEVGGPVERAAVGVAGTEPRAAVQRGGVAATGR